MKYLLDTNIVSALEKAPTGPLLAHISKVGLDNVVTSIIVSGELQFGVAKAVTAKQRDNLTTLLGSITVLPLEAPAATSYGTIRADLERKGTPIGQNDLWIAAHALALDLTLVTDNVSEFGRVEGLRVENWLRS
jgi:tRNA(fMet)-specific endonuclease VapC